MNNITLPHPELAMTSSLGRDPRYVGRLVMLRHTELFLASVTTGYPDLKVIGQDRVSWLVGCSWSSLRRYFSPYDKVVRWVNNEAITVYRLDLYAIGAKPWSLAHAPPNRQKFQFRDIAKMFDSAD